MDAPVYRALYTGTVASQIPRKGGGRGKDTPHTSLTHSKTCQNLVLLSWMVQSEPRHTQRVRIEVRGKCRQAGQTAFIGLPLLDHNCRAFPHHALNETHQGHVKFIHSQSFSTHTNPLYSLSQPPHWWLSSLKPISRYPFSQTSDFLWTYTHPPNSDHPSWPCVRITSEHMNLRPSNIFTSQF